MPRVLVGREVGCTDFRKWGLSFMCCAYGEAEGLRIVAGNGTGVLRFQGGGVAAGVILSFFFFTYSCGCGCSCGWSFYQFY